MSATNSAAGFDKPPTLRRSNSCGAVAGLLSRKHQPTVQNDPWVHAGLLPRILRRFFETFGECPLRISILEIYRESLYDLLNDRATVRCCHSSAATVTQSVTKWRVLTLAEALAVIKRGSRKRVEARTGMNLASSRGHLIILLEHQATLCVVDLAGKEAEAGRG